MHDPNDARQVREAERLEKQAQERIADDLCAVMATESGRRERPGLGYSFRPWDTSKN